MKGPLRRGNELEVRTDIWTRRNQVFVVRTSSTGGLGGGRSGTAALVKGCTRYFRFAQVIADDGRLGLPAAFSLSFNTQFSCAQLQKCGCIHSFSDEASRDVVND